MNISNLSILKLASEKISYLAARHSTISQNIANADTPGYISRDLAPFEEVMNRVSRSPGPQRTHDSHLSGSNSPASRQGGSRPGESYEIAPSGNGVILEEEMLKSSGINGEHDLVSTIYRKNVDLIKTVIASR